VVRHHHAIAADRRRALGVVGPLDAFQQQPARPLVAELLDVFPVETGIHLATHRGDDIGAARRAERIALEVRHARQAIAQHVERPRRLEDHVARVAPVRAVRRVEAVARVALALPGHRQVDGDEDRLVARILRPLDEPRPELEVAHAIELVPEAAADFLRDALDAERRRRRHGEGHAQGLGRAREHQLRAEAAGADAAGRGDGERQVHGPAEKLGFQVDGDEDRFVARVFRALDKLPAEVEVAHAVELEPQPTAHFLGDPLDAERRGRRHGEGHAGGLRGTGEDQLRAMASGADAAGRRDGERQRRFTSKNGNLGIDLRDIHEDFRQQPHPLEGGAVLAQRHLVLRPAVEEIEYRPRQAPARHLPQVLDVDRLVEAGHIEFALDSTA